MGCNSEPLASRVRNTYKLQFVSNNPFINTSTSESGGHSQDRPRRSKCTRTTKNTASGESCSYDICTKPRPHFLCELELLASSVRNTYVLQSVPDKPIGNTSKLKSAWSSSCRTTDSRHRKCRRTTKSTANGGVTVSCNYQNRGLGHTHALNRGDNFYATLNC